MAMRRLGFVSAWIGLIVVFAAGIALAQSSGNFDAAVDPTVCVLNSSTGTLSPLCIPTTNGHSCALLDTTIKTSNGNGVTLLITPSMVTGLFTNTKLSSTINTATADIGIQVCVTVEGGKVLPNTANVTSGSNPADTGCVVYDQRFQQISNTLFANVTSCAAGNAGAVCTSDANCTGGTICGPPNVDGGSVCTCGFDLTLSTLSAHAFNFMAQVPGDNTPHHVTAEWTLIGVNQTTGSSSVAACVGPGDVTVTQTKIFKNSGSNLAF
jgi:hypothetical protein